MAEKSGSEIIKNTGIQSYVQWHGDASMYKTLYCLLFCLPPDVVSAITPIRNNNKQMCTTTTRTTTFYDRIETEESPTPGVIRVVVVVVVTVVVVVVVVSVLHLQLNLSLLKQSSKSSVELQANWPRGQKRLYTISDSCS